MGLTGSGKSTFINLFSEEKSIVGNTLESCTGRVDIFKCYDSHIGTFYLVDTPGFDDTYRSDTEILQDVAGWLSKMKGGNLLLTGILYLHKISDNRMSGSSMKNLRSFKKLCGAKAMSQVVLATTMWGITDRTTAKRHESDLTTTKDYWGSMIANGSKVFRQDRNEVSGREIIQYLIEQRYLNSDLKPLAIQTEMEQGKTLYETGAGQEMRSELAKLTEVYEAKLERLERNLQSAVREHDKAWQAELLKTRNEYQAIVQQAKEDKESLRKDHKALEKRLELNSGIDYKTWQKQHDERAVQIEKLKGEVKMLKQHVENEEKKNELKLQISEEKQKLATLRRRIEQAAPRCTVM
ncbi:uncharacterized protein AB675_12017 [Cyphellophora attinorum]|uniref:G domain-containing protein n=1 Tax=Cyphellophora attinorum TaxID=1664694 RepID=A0A0N1NXG0_9EURO|nr:uncharacterized protein AB675_12017 [Phialophora attinorum]KPI38425.1 hypothetical protein AB675_12017 [Phialophora attinorum]